MKIEDYRNCKYFTKKMLVSIISNCGEEELNPENYKKEELIAIAKKAQNKVIAEHGHLYPGEY
jgi:hypothetical protein